MQIQNINELQWYKLRNQWRTYRGFAEPELIHDKRGGAHLLATPLLVRPKLKILYQLLLKRFCVTVSIDKKKTM